MANKAELHIVVDERGQVSVTAPFHDKMVCYALLEMARDIVKDKNAEMASGIVRATPADLPAPDPRLPRIVR